ncbi:MAG: phage holin family protein [Patescibacteria group bacterium]
MKKVFRMIVFSALALLLTSLWNKGFIISSSLSTFLVATISLALVFYIIVPISKIVFLPFNLLTLGFMSFLIYIVILHFYTWSFHLFEIRPWEFDGFRFGFVQIPATNISYLGNLVLSSLSISSIINLLELLV